MSFPGAVEEGDTRGRTSTVVAKEEAYEAHHYQNRHNRTLEERAFRDFELERSTGAVSEDSIKIEFLKIGDTTFTTEQGGITGRLYEIYYAVFLDEWKEIRGQSIELGSYVISAKDEKSKAKKEFDASKLGKKIEELKRGYSDSYGYVVKIKDFIEKIRPVLEQMDFTPLNKKGVEALLKSTTANYTQHALLCHETALGQIKMMRDLQTQAEQLDSQYVKSLATLSVYIEDLNLILEERKPKRSFKSRVKRVVETIQQQSTPLVQRSRAASTTDLLSRSDISSATRRRADTNPPSFMRNPSSELLPPSTSTNILSANSLRHSGDHDEETESDSSFLSFGDSSSAHSSLSSLSTPTSSSSTRSSDSRRSLRWSCEFHEPMPYCGEPEEERQVQKPATPSRPLPSPPNAPSPVRRPLPILNPQSSAPSGGDIGLSERDRSVSNPPPPPDAKVLPPPPNKPGDKRRFTTVAPLDRQPVHEVTRGFSKEQWRAMVLPGVKPADTKDRGKPPAAHSSLVPARAASSVSSVPLSLTASSGPVPFRLPPHPARPLSPTPGGSPLIGRASMLSPPQPGQPPIQRQAPVKGSAPPPNRPIPGRVRLPGLDVKK